MRKTTFVCLQMTLVAALSASIPFHAAAATGGLNLYTWQEKDGTPAFSILPKTEEAGTASPKVEEILAHKVPIAEIEHELKVAPTGTNIIWNQAPSAKSGAPQFQLPDATSYNRIRQAAAQARVHLTIAQ